MILIWGDEERRKERKERRVGAFEEVAKRKRYDFNMVLVIREFFWGCLLGGICYLLSLSFCSSKVKGCDLGCLLIVLIVVH